MATSAMVQAMLYPEEKEKTDLRIKANAYLTNPFLRKDGSLVNKYMNYEALLDSPNVNSKVKQYITEATGLTEKVKPVSFSANQNRYSGESIPINGENTASGDTSNADVSNTNASTENTPQNVNNMAVSSNSGGRLGSISAKYEAGGWNPGAVSSGSGDYGGVSYGMPQFSTTTGSAKSFVNWLKQSNPEIGSMFGGYSPGTSEFSSAWKNAAAKYGDTFGNLQNQYVYNNIVMPFVQKAKEKTGVDLNSTPALRELAFSTAIQFGGAGTYALGSIDSNMSEKDIINAVYNNKINNVATYFRSSSKDVQNGVKNRFVNERNDLLSLAN